LLKVYIICDAASRSEFVIVRSCSWRYTFQYWSYSWSWKTDSYSSLTTD